MGRLQSRSPKGTSKMTTSEDDVTYTSILEAVVAVLAVKCGADPNALLGRVIEDITEQSSMETSATERIIRERWSNRPLTPAAMVAKTLPVSLTGGSQSVNLTAEKPDMRSRLRAYTARRSEGSSDTPS